MRRTAVAILLVGFALALAGAVMPEALATATRPDMADQAPSMTHWLGTDRHGRDIATRIVIGLANAVWPALGACLVAAVFGIPLGTLLARHPRRLGRIIELASATLVVVPRYVLVLLVLTIAGDDMWWMAIAAGLAWTPSVLDSVAARVRQLIDSDGILASRLHGISEWRLISWHIVWHGTRRTVARQLLGLFGAFLILESSLSYIGGLGVPEPRPSIGNLIAAQWGQSAWLDVRFWSPVAVLLVLTGSARLVAHSLREPTHD